MRQREWKKLKEWVAKLTFGQRHELMGELTADDEIVACVGIIENHGKPEQCPRCGSVHVVRNGSASGLQRYKCRGCSRTFNGLTGTPLARLRLKPKWLSQAEALRDGVTITKAAERLKVARSTAFRWRHRFMALPKTIQAQKLVGIAEADETFFLHSDKGQRGLDRKPRRRGGSAAKRGLSKEQIPVLVARDRSGATANFILAADGKADLVAALKPLLPLDTILCTDGSSVLAAAVKEIGVTHRPINVSAGRRVIAGVYHIQNVNAFDSRLKNWIRRFHGVATKYLDSYLGWFRTLDRSSSTGLQPASLLALAVGRQAVLN
ncbi:MAG: IS1595 family transposase [Hydrogenophilales bacterium]|nr:IS1595 family transposase [Hydrogenophilales bacterium]